MSKLYILLSESATGKDTLFRELIKTQFFEPCVSHTTRPMRTSEMDGVEYHFISDDTFKQMESNNSFIETRKYKVEGGDTWYYGLSKAELMDSNIVIVDVEGKREIERSLGKENVVSILLKAKPSTRLIRSINRQKQQIDEELSLGNASKTLNEIYRRLEADNRDFRDVESEVNYILSNEDECDLWNNLEYINDLYCEEEF